MNEPKRFAIELKKRLEELSKAQKIGQSVGLIPSNQPKANDGKQANPL